MASENMNESNEESEWKVEIRNMNKRVDRLQRKHVLHMKALEAFTMMLKHFEFQDWINQCIYDIRVVHE